MKVYNKSKEMWERAVKASCPRCEGFGGTSADKGESCSFCKGRGILWKSANGWLRALYDNHSFLY